jgi:hypothetical protein
MKTLIILATSLSDGDFFAFVAGAIILIFAYFHFLRFLFKTNENAANIKECKKLLERIAAKMDPEGEPK